MSGSVLIVDDDDALAENVPRSWRASASRRPSRATERPRSALAAGRDFDVALIDVRLPDGDGLSLLEPLRAASSVHPARCWSPETPPSKARSRPCAATPSPTCSSRSPRPICWTPSGGALEQAGLYRERERLRARARALGAPAPRSGRVGAGLRAGPRRARADRDLEPPARTGDRLLAGRDAGRRRAPRWSGSDEPSARSPAQGREAPARCAGAAPRFPGQGGAALRLRRRHRRDRRGGDAAADLLRRSAWRRSAPWPPAWPTRCAIRSTPRRCSSPCSSDGWSEARPDDKAMPIARIIKSEIDRLDRLVRDFLAFAKPTPLEPAAGRRARSSCAGSPT